jgi:hypothetical protein
MGHVKLAKIQPDTLQRFYNKLRDEGKVHAAFAAHRRLTTVFKLAVLWGWMAFNPCERVIPPKYKPKRKELWSQEELTTSPTP